MTDSPWQNVGAADDLKQRGIAEAALGRQKIAVTWKDNRWGVVSNVCNHVGGPLGQGSLDGDYLTCPWHNWKFHRCTGLGEPGFEDDAVPSYEVREEDGRLLVRVEPVTPRNLLPCTCTRSHCRTAAEMSLLNPGVIFVELS